MEKLFDNKAMQDVFKAGIESATQISDLWRTAFDGHVETSQKLASDALQRSFDALRATQKLADETMRRGTESAQKIMAQIEQVIAA